MKRLPYGTFKTLTPEEQKEHKRKLASRWRKKNRQKFNSYNQKYYDLWKKTLPFECVCQTCGKTFNACRKNRFMCPDCHELRKKRYENKRMQSQQNTQNRLKLENKVIELYNSGVLQKDIARKFNTTQSAISYICRVNGFYRGKKRSVK